MDCDFCQMRGNVGFCVECQKLLCEECGKACAGCHKMVCPEHAKTTPHGRILCPACMEERQKKREAIEAAESTKFEDLDETVAHARKAIEAEPDEERLLTQSGYQARAPWARSLRSLAPAVIGLWVCFRYPTLGVIVQPWLSAVMIAFCIIAALWALHGLRSDQLRGRRALNVLGLALALLLLVGAVYAL